MMKTFAPDIYKLIWAVIEGQFAILGTVFAIAIAMSLVSNTSGISVSDVVVLAIGLLVYASSLRFRRIDPEAFLQGTQLYEKIAIEMSYMGLSLSTVACLLVLLEQLTLYDVTDILSIVFVAAFELLYHEIPSSLITMIFGMLWLVGVSAYVYTKDRNANRTEMRFYLVMIAGIIAVAAIDDLVALFSQSNLLHRYIWLVLGAPFSIIVKLLFHGTSVQKILRQ